MAEDRTGFGGNQRLVAGATGLIIIVALLFFFLVRSCGPTGPKMTVIYSNLDLSDAAKVITRLKEIKISYELRDKGTAIAVPKEQADNARLGLAEKNLPTGGVVGWEIFNETRMGATDFDRRIQLIRAISGELSRTIKRIEGVEDARVQIVMPETRLFETTTVPVTASVLLRVSPGSRIKAEQIRGIIHLVASSVENLKPENVTVVDDSGKILSAEAAPPLPKIPEEALSAEAVAPVEAAKVITKEVIAAPTNPEVKQITEEEKVLLRLKAKEEYERQLAGSAQSLINRFLPPNTAMVKVKVEFGLPNNKKPYTRLKIKSDSYVVSADISKLTVIVLIDKKFKLTEEIKRNLYQTIALSIPYNKARGDLISISRVPFQTFVPPPEFAEAPFTEKQKPKPQPNYFKWTLILAGGIFIAVIIVMAARRGKEKPIGTDTVPEIHEFREQYPTAEEAGDAVAQIKNLAERNPEKIANLIKKWLTEEG